ncbi:MAG TPA: aspartate-semialdehyde dehydrogenase [Anaerolineales bacterium]|nr:aspartate-semialdehyde dehydrogenase [Anaerolineales bacterium]
MSNKRKVAVLGATGAVGQRFVQLLDKHPWFEVTALTGSDRTVGGTYGDGCRWVLAGDMPEWARAMKVVDTKAGIDADIVFSALPTDMAKTAEPEFAQAGHQVFSNASSYRMAEDVPLLIPEVNAEHAHLVRTQRQLRGWSGSIVCNSNCTSTGFTVSLKPLVQNFGVKTVFAVSMQAASGAGYPGVPSLDLIDNVVPYIGGEESKLAAEPRKMLGSLQGERIAEYDIRISAHTNRVPVLDGHLVCVTAELGTPVSPADVIAAMRSFKADALVQELPSTGNPAIIVRDEADRPQPRRDRDAGAGMTTVVGRVREDEILHIKYVVLSHNTIKGAAGGSLQNAELCVALGLA